MILMKAKQERAFLCLPAGSAQQKAQTAEDSKRAALEAEKRARMKHAAKQRRRALEILVAKKKK